MSRRLPKDFSKEIAKEYLPREVEAGWYEWWEHQGFFKPASDRDPTKASAKKFVIVIPPPNVTGYLHLGHALTGAVQDTLIRWHRMRGDDTLYVPGTDHAGIATQVVVEKRIKAEEGLSRHDLGREAFLKKVWEWKTVHGGFICKQLRLLGSSLDWSREHFTMDEKCSKAVNEAFVRFHEDGIMYRATRLVNWCPTLQSAISDLEVEYIDVTPGLFIRIPGYDKTVEVGTITCFAYKIVGSDEEIVVQTTRPETILGDTAVAVHPDDPRYKKFAGARLQCPFREDTIPLVFDGVLADMNFGTGAVKVTPAHDPNDFECGIRNKLPFINILDTKGQITSPGQFAGMHRYDCRRAIVKALDEKGLLRERKGHTMRLGTCSRTGDIVEPYLVPQWFVDCSKMAARSVEAVRSGELKLIPPNPHETTWFHWLENIKPWCVSRQLWWGHRIPAWSLSIDGKPVANDPNENWTVGRNIEEAKAKAIAKFKLSDADVAKLVLTQDEDVLDTWFSSALWPFEVMGWPNDTSSDMQRFFPGSLLETGHDILFFWVARMVMTSLHLTNKLPFKEVYLHAMVRDKEGNKMSKSKGNVIDPLDVLYGIKLDDLHAKLMTSNLDAKEIEPAKALQKKTFPNGIPECGADALRFGLLSYTCSGKNVNLDIERIVGYRQFCNKLWNVIRYALHYALGTDYVPRTDIVLSPSMDLPLDCRWILSRLDKCAADCNAGFAEGQYDFAQTTTAAYSFWLHDFCDVFLELTKPTMQLPKEDPRAIITRYVLYYTIERALRLLHPMMPYVTEELWHRLPNSENFPTETILTAEYPQPAGFHHAQAEADMGVLNDIIHSLRSMKSGYRLTNKIKPDIWILCTNPEQTKNIAAHTNDIIATLSVCGNVVVAASKADVPKGCGMTVVSSEVTVCMMLKGYIDPAKEAEGLNKKLEMANKQLTGVKAKMNIPGYETKVPEDVRQTNAQKFADLTAEINLLQSALESLKEMTA